MATLNSIENVFSLGPWHLRIVHNDQWIVQADFIMPAGLVPPLNDSSVMETALGPNSWTSQADPYAGRSTAVSTPEAYTAECVQGPRSDLTHTIETYMNDYLSHRSPTVTLPLASQGTSFRQRVWAALRAIPAGSTMTYGQLARTLNSAAQPIGGACRHNPIAFFTPCHRVVSVTGLGGFMGLAQASAQLQCKAWLLQHEQGFHDV